MPIPGVGFTEVAIILVAALLIFGPDKLPEIMGQAGRAIRDFRKMTGNLQGEFEKNLNEVAGTDVRKTLSNEIAGLKGEVQSATNAVNGKPATRTTTAAKSTTGAKTTTAGKSTATSTTKPSTTATSRTTTPSTARASTTTGSVVGSGAAKAAAEPVIEESREIEFVPVVTSTRRRSSAAPAAASAAPVTIPASRPAATSGAAPVAVADGAGDADGLDPFARARSRRQAAGYQR
jgi:sec-independent protein translocase protein TatB